jgi:hypothetical protein
MNIELLQTFCHNDPELSLAKPWTKDGFTYASNGSILVRVPALPEDPGGRGVGPNALYDHAGPIPEDGWIDVPGLPEPAICLSCKGNPGVSSTCPECDGDGEVELSNVYSHYTCDCKTCDGSGEVEGCSKCHGSGMAKEMTFIQIGSRRYKVAVIRMITTLPKAQIAPTNENITWVRFDGGDALVMPLTEAHIQDQFGDLTDIVHNRTT